MLHLKDFSSIPKHPQLVGDNAPHGTELGRGIVPNDIIEPNAMSADAQLDFAIQAARELSSVVRWR